MDSFIRLLTRMACYTVNGDYQSVVTGEDTVVAGPLIENFEQCGQPVAKAIRNISLASFMTNP